MLNARKKNKNVSKTNPGSTKYCYCQGCKASRMPHHNNIIEAYLTILCLLWEHIKTLRSANTRLDKKQGLGHREHHFSNITLSALRLASFTIHNATICTIIHGSNSRTHNSIHMSSIYTHRYHKPTMPQSLKAIVSDTSM